MKVRVIVHQLDHSVCFDKDGQFLAGIDNLDHGELAAPVGPFICQHKKRAVILTCELQVPRKEA